MCAHSNVFVTFECVGMSKLMTQSTCGMSKPRDATSVASSTERDFDLNLFKEPRRLFYTQHKPLSHRLLHSRNPDIHTCVIVQVFLFSQESNSVFTQAHIKYISEVHAAVPVPSLGGAQSTTIEKCVCTWLICPWSGMAVMPRFLRTSVTRCVLLHVLQKTMNEFPANSFSMETR